MGKRVRKTQSGIEICSKEETVILDSTDGTDIIESSILKYENDHNFIQKRKINRVNDTPKSSMQVQINQSKQVKKTSVSMKDTSNALKLSVTKTNGQASNVESIEKIDLPQTPCPTKNSKDAHSIIKKLISTLKKTPEGPYLSKSKLRNIEQWLNENDIETVTTPPFANLSVTPINPLRKRLSSRWEERKKHQEDSSIDSEVEGVLKAVYGEDWKRENVQGRAKTEPKKKSNKFFTPVTETKKRKVRRNILIAKKPNWVDNSDKENRLDDSVLSGIRMIHLDSSFSSEEQGNSKDINFIRKERARKCRTEINSVDSLCLSPVENIKSKTPSSNRKNVRKETPAKKDFSLKTPGSEIPPKTPKKTFLASLSVSTPTSRCHPDAQYYKINFKAKKDELVKKLYKLYNSEVFDGRLAEDLNYSWNIKLRGTAGYCYNKRITKSTGEVIRMSRIEFSTKIVDRADRLRDTMIHELCHAASWVIDGVLDGHGDVWTKWASKAMRRFSELPTIRRCHNYDIVSKYLYRCTGCGYSIKRHSKSINTDRKRCGHCYGVLELLINKKRKGKGEVPEFDTTKTLPTPNKFAMFVKENYHSVKSFNANAKHSEIMKTLGEQYALIKNGYASCKKLSQE